MKAKKFKVEDAMHATRAGVEEGIIPGGGIMLLKAQEALKTLKFDNKDEETGINIIKVALESPIRMISENAGLDASVVVNRVRESKYELGLNAETGEYVDMLKQVLWIRQKL